MGWGAHHCPLGLHALWGLRAAGVAGGRPRGGGLPPLRGASGVRRCPSPCQPSSGAGGRGPATRVSRVRSAGVGTQHRPHSVRPCGPALLAVGVAEGRPRGGRLPPLQGAFEVRRSPSPDCPPTGRAVGVRYPSAVGAGVWVWGPNTVPLACTPCGGCVPRGWWGAVPGRGGGLPPLRGASGVRRCPSPDHPSSGAGSVSRVRSVRAWGPGTGSTACALAGRRCSLWEWRKGVPGGGGAFHRCEGRLRSGAPPTSTARPLGGLLGSVNHVLWARVCGCGGPTLSPWPACPVGAAYRGGAGGPSPGEVACHRCEGRLVSGAVPSPAARPLGRAAGVPRPVCPGCGLCGRGDPAPAPQRAPLRAGVARCGSGGRASPRGVPSTVMRGVLGQALPLPRLPAHWAGCWGPSPACCGRGRVGVGAHHCPLGLHAHLAAACRGAGGGPSPGGMARHRCEGHLLSGAVPPPAARPLGRAAGVPLPVCPGCRRCGRGTQHRPHSVCPCGPALLAVGLAEGRSRGAAFHRCEERLWSGAPPPRTARPLVGLLGSATHMLWAQRVGVGAQHCPLGLHALSGLRAVGVVGGRPRGGWPATIVGGVWCQALSLPRPPDLWGGQPGFRDPCVPGAVGAGLGTQHRPQGARPCGPALRAVGVAVGRPRGGCPPPL